MHPENRHLAGHMIQFGLSALGRAVVDATFAEMGAPYAHAMSVSIAAHAAEVLVKARIVQEHPLLIFERLPRSGAVDGQLRVEALLEHGRSIQYADLPERLWAVAGYRMGDPQAFEQFGRLRNQIVHVGWQSRPDISSDTLRFVFEVMEPMLIDFWNKSVVPHAQTWDDVIAEGYLQKRLARGKIVPPEPTRAHLESLARI